MSRSKWVRAVNGAGRRNAIDIELFLPMPPVAERYFHTTWKKYRTTFSVR